MHTRKLIVSAVVVCVLSVLGIGLALAQEPDRQERPPREDRGSRRDPAQMRQRMMDGIKEKLQAKDDEWKVIQPRLEKVMTLSRDARSATNMRSLFGRGGRTRRPTETTEPAPPQSDTAKALEALQKALENEKATAEEIKTKLTALREAREKAKQDLVKAQEALCELITQRQEAELVVLGYLD